AYLVNGPAHCDACHTPKTILGGNGGAALSGATLQGWFAPNITKDAKRGVGSWSVEDVVAYLKNGHNDHAMATGPMAEAIEDSTSLRHTAALGAIAVYQKALPEGGGGQETATDQNAPRMKRGVAIYRNNCAACQGDDGKGKSPIFPPLAGNPII